MLSEFETLVNKTVWRDLIKKTFSNLQSNKNTQNTCFKMLFSKLMQKIILF